MAEMAMRWVDLRPTSGSAGDPAPRPLRHGLVAGAATAALVAVASAHGEPRSTEALVAVSLVACTALLGAAGLVLLVLARTVAARPRHRTVATAVGCGLIVMTGLGGLLAEVWQVVGAPPGGWTATVPLAALVIHHGLDRAQDVHHPATAVGLVACAVTIVVVCSAPGVGPGAQLVVPAVVSAGALASLAWRCGRHRWLPEAYRGAVGVGLGALALDNLLAATAPDGAGLLLRAAVAVTGCVVLLSAAWAWTTDTGRENDGRVTVLMTELADREEQITLTRTRLHDARATLAGIRAAQSALEQVTIPDAERDALRRAMEAEIEHLVHQLSGRQSPTGPTRLDDALTPLVLTRRQQGLDVRYSGTDAEVAVGVEVVSDIVQNLLDNARDHAPGSTVRLAVDEVGSHVCVSVTDDGPGVPAGLQPAVLHAGVKGRHSRGEGLGLASASRRAAEAGGDLQMLSTSGGTWFIVRLPAVGPDDASRS